MSRTDLGCPFGAWVAASRRIAFSLGSGVSVIERCLDLWRRSGAAAEAVRDLSGRRGPRFYLGFIEPWLHSNLRGGIS
jgi:hypothetical protein